MKKKREESLVSYPDVLRALNRDVTHGLHVSVGQVDVLATRFGKHGKPEKCGPSMTITAIANERHCTFVGVNAVVEAEDGRRFAARIIQRGDLKFEGLPQEGTLKLIVGQ
jgi:hypothetical protein